MDREMEQAPEVSVAEFAAMPRDGVQVIDVREQDEQDEGHIPGALHIPLGMLDERVGELEPGRPVVVVCKSGGRSLIAATYLQRIGFRQAVSLAEGTQGWIAAGHPVE